MPSSRMPHGSSSSRWYPVRWHLPSRRSSAAAERSRVGGIGLFASFLINGYASSISALEALKPISYFAITANHRPLAGVEDWPAVGAVALAAVALLAAGVAAFSRRDLLVPTGGRVRLPTLPLFLRRAVHAEPRGAAPRLGRLGPRAGVVRNDHLVLRR